MVEIKIGDDYIVETSGSLITFDNLPIKVNIDGMMVEIVFTKDPSTEKLRSKNTIVNKNLMKIEFFNFEGELSYRNKPQEILAIDDKVYYLDLIISALGTEKMLLNYMILSKKR